jgi:hypothetical protein
MAKKTNAILTKLYTHVSKSIKTNIKGYNKYLSNFIEFRAKDLYDTAPCERIFFKDQDEADYFTMTKIDKGLVVDSIGETYYAHIPNFNPRAAKDPLTISQMCVIRHFYLSRDKKNLELAMTYLAFSGKFYPSIHYASYPKTPPSQYRHVMDYVINNELTEKYDLKSQGSVIGAIRSICNTWIESYGSKFKSFSDDDIVYLIQQLHSRIKSFMKNIANLYYAAYKNRDTYLAYSQESLDPDDFHMSDNDALLAERIVERTMERINTKGVDYMTCYKASDVNVKVNEVKSIMETIITNPDEQSSVKELIGLMVSTYFRASPAKDIHDIGFVTYSISTKPNSKDPYIMRIQEIIETWLNEKSPAYRKRNHRLETKSSYHRSVLAYFALTIYDANK